MKIVVEDRSDPATPDAGLVRVLVRAHVIRDRLLQDKSRTLDEIAKSEGMVASYATRLFRLTLLAPNIVSAILGGKHPPELTVRKSWMTRDCRSIGTSSDKLSGSREHCQNQNPRHQFNTRPTCSLF